MKSQILHTVWCNIAGEAAGELLDRSLSGVKGLNNYDYNYDVQNAPCPTPHGRVAKHRVDWKEHYHLLFEDTPLSNSRWTSRDLVAVLRDQAFAWERPGHWYAKSHQRGKIPKTLFTETR